MRAASLVESRDHHVSPHALARACRADTDALGETIAALAARLHAATYELLVLLHEFGHAFACRSVGGIRASIYNAMPMEGVQALAQYMTDFAKKNA